MLGVEHSELSGHRVAPTAVVRKTQSGTRVGLERPSSRCNPVVGYCATAKAVNLLFWNGKRSKTPH